MNLYRELVGYWGALLIWAMIIFGVAGILALVIGALIL